MEYKYRTAPAALDTEHEGRLKAAVSVFDEIDSDGDIVRASAFTDGQAVPLVWAHDWTKPVGKGVITVEQKQAIFDGAFFTDTAAGLDAYRTVKAMGELQEFSWGFQILDQIKGKPTDSHKREITKATVFEVSPVLVGANRNTRTLAIKGQSRSWDDQDEALTLELEDYLARARSLADLRAKEGRALSTQRRTRLEQMRDVLSSGLEELNRLLEETTPRSADEESEGERAKQIRQIEADHLALMARALGVQV
jgi:HK97 family phage prohead protease